MFTPNPERAAAELVRVCRPGGRIGLANWTPEGFVGQMFKIVGQHVAAAAGRALAADVGHRGPARRSCSAPHAKVEIARKPFTFRYRSAEDFFETFKAYYGPMVRAWACARRRRPGVAARPARRAGRRRQPEHDRQRCPSTRSTSRWSRPATTTDVDAGQPGPVTRSWWAPQMKTASVAGSSPGFDQRWRVPFCTTVSPGLEAHRRTVVELEAHLAGQHDLEVDRVGGVHAGIAPVPCGRASRAAPCSARSPRRAMSTSGPGAGSPCGGR